MTGPARCHREARPVANYRDAPAVAIDAVYLRAGHYERVVVMADPATCNVYVFGPYDQKASLFELTHPEWLVGTYTRKAAHAQIAGDLLEHLREAV